MELHENEPYRCQGNQTDVIVVSFEKFGWHLVSELNSTCICELNLLDTAQVKIQSFLQSGCTLSAKRVSAVNICK